MHPFTDLIAELDLIFDAAQSCIWIFSYNKIELALILLKRQNVLHRNVFSSKIQMISAADSNSRESKH